jgi:transcriptional regulator with XRE-family HTH domain
MKMSEKIKILRKEKKWSQAELAETLNVHVTHISRLETGKYAPSLELLKKIAEMFGVTTDYLLYDSIESLEPVTIQNKPLYERMKLVDSLEEEDRKILVGVIETFLTKQQMWNVLNKARGLVGSGQVR